MNWQEIKISADGTHFLYIDNPVFGRKFIEVLKFHAPGLAPVKDETGAYHIDVWGNNLYEERYSRTFGYYCNRAAIVKDGTWCHLTEQGEPAYHHFFSWTGNYQEDICPVRDIDGNYFHIDLAGKRIYTEKYTYCGDFKDRVACVRTVNGFYRHIDNLGAFLNDKEFLDLGIFHKNFATAKDKDGWFHINRSGKELYKNRFTSIEPFYNGFALVETAANVKCIIDESGNMVLNLAANANIF